MAKKNKLNLPKEERYESEGMEVVKVDFPTNRVFHLEQLREIKGYCPHFGRCPYGDCYQKAQNRDAPRLRCLEIERENYKNKVLASNGLVDFLSLIRPIR
jgi:hypothetical protein